MIKKDPEHAAVWLHELFNPEYFFEGRDVCDYNVELLNEAVTVYTIRTMLSEDSWTIWDLCATEISKMCNAKQLSQIDAAHEVLKNLLKELELKVYEDYKAADRNRRMPMNEVEHWIHILYYQTALTIIDNW